MGKLDDPKLEGKLLLLAGDFAITLLLTAGTALSVLSGYRLDADGGAVIAFCAAASAASAVLHSLSRPWWSLGAAAAIATVFWRMWEEILPVLQWIGQAMGLSSLYLVWSSRREEHLLPVFLLLCAALAWLMGWAAVRLRAWYLAALLALTPVLPAIQMGVLPAWGAMLAAFAGWGCLLLTSLFRREDPEGLGRAQLLSLTGMGVLLMALVMSLPMEGYRRPQWATNARDNLAMGLHRQLERHFGAEALEGGFLADLGLDLSVPVGTDGQGPAVEVGSMGTVGSGDTRRENLLAAGPRRYAGQRVLTVSTSPADAGRIYLRGSSLGTYTGDSWEAAEPGTQPFFPDGSGEAAAQPALYPAQTAPGAEIYIMNIQSRGNQDVCFYPYRLSGGSGRTDEAGVLPMPDDVGWAGGVWPSREEYRVDYVPGGPENGFTPLPEPTAMEEGRYQAEVVYGYRYLEVPDRARAALEPLLSGERWGLIVESLEQQLAAAEGDERAKLEGSLERIRKIQAAAVTLEDMDVSVELPEGLEQFWWPLTAAARTAALLDRQAVYDLDTPAMEQGEDFVSHFLTEGRGYCTHFATAGALLLRMQGIPARYVTGYTVQLDGQGRGEALDSDAHAWVEIYLDGYGWHPVEMTPGYAGGEAGISLVEDLGAEKPGQPEKQEPQEETPGEELPQEDPGQLPLPGETAGQEEEDAGESALDSGAVRALAAVGTAACALGGLYALAVLLRRRERRDPDTNRSAIRAYRRYERALRWGGAESEALETLGRKARFSQHTLTEEEREAAWRSLDEASEAVQKGRKLLPRRLFALLRPLL